MCVRDSDATHGMDSMDHEDASVFADSRRDTYEPI